MPQPFEVRRETYESIPSEENDDSSKPEISVSYAVLLTILSTMFISGIMAILWSTPNAPCPPGTCCPGTAGVVNGTYAATGLPGPSDQLPWITWTTDLGVTLPYYSSGSIAETNQSNITNAVIIQHGLLRDANDYYCAAYSALQNITESLSGGSGYGSSFENTIIIAPQFLVSGDICWDSNGFSYISNLDPSDDGTVIDCGIPFWENDANSSDTGGSWISGDLSINSVTTDTGAPYYLYSFDVYNLIINRLSDPAYFPNLSNITLFGFSAGAQVSGCA